MIKLIGLATEWPQAQKGQLAPPHTSTKGAARSPAHYTSHIPDFMQMVTLRMKPYAVASTCNNSN